MTLYTLSKQQEKFIVDNLYLKYQKRNFMPERVMYYIDKHTGIFGFACLKHGMPGMFFQWTIEGMTGYTFNHYEINEEDAEEQLNYIETKKLFHLFQKTLIQW